MRIGNGYDVHRLVEGRDLIIGGVHIPYEKGLLGHSDADVLLHAIMDALLGAAGLGDIGQHFPDTDPKYEGADSLKLLEHVKKLLDGEFLAVGNIDATIVAQAPKMKPYLEQMEENVAKALDISVTQVNIKATTEEHLGFTGDGSGISASAVCLLESFGESGRLAASTDADGNILPACAGCAGCFAAAAAGDADEEISSEDQTGDSEKEDYHMDGAD